MPDRVEVFGPWKLSSGRWRGYVRGPDGKRRERNAATRTACAERLDRTRREVEAGIEGRRTYGHWIDVAVSAAKPGGAPPSENTLQHRRYLADLVPAWLAEKPIGQVRPLDVEDAIDAILAAPTASGRRRNRNTVGKVRHLLINAWNRAARAGEVAGNNPARLTDAIAEEQETEPRWLDVDDATKVLVELEDHPWRAAYILMATVGPRRGETLGLTWDRVDLDRGVVRLGPTITRTVDGKIVEGGPKTEAGWRTVRLPAFAAEALRRHAADLGCAHRHVFADPATGAVPHPDSLRKPLARACARAGVQPPVTPHGLRHSAASIALASGADSRAVMDLLGQRDPRMMARYQHVLDRLRERTATHLDGVWGT